jgi:RTX calcium-binding nonapeptide repeat (4 copies)/Peptidase M10 serralysin C terminal
MPTYPSAWTDQQIANQITRSGLHWTQTSLTYSFNDLSTAGNALDATYQLWVSRAVQIVGEMIGINFTQVAGSGAITFNGSVNDGSYASTAWNVPSNNLTSANIYFDRSWSTNQSAVLGYGSYGLTTIIHELLHALGLEHPGNYNTTASYFPDALFLQDTARYSVMSYFDADWDGSGLSHWFKSAGVWHWENPQTPMVYDLLALTNGGFSGHFSGYSATIDTRLGDTTYGYNATAGINAVYNFVLNQAPVLTIYDAGSNDTLDLSGDTVATARTLTYNTAGVSTPADVTRTSTVIDIRPGAYSSTHGMSNNIGIAFRTVIENVTGTNFNDTITGNDAANILRGGLGNDTIYGGAGNDSVEGGAGADTLDGGEFETDTLNYLLSDAAVRVNTGTSSAAGGHAAGDVISNFESVLGSAFNDILSASGLGSALAGNAGNDFLYSTFGTWLTGGAGSDWFVFIDDQGGPGSAGSVSDLTSSDYVYIGGTTAKPVFSASGGSVSIGNYWLIGAAFANVTVITQATNTLLFDTNVSAINSVLAGGISALGAIGAYSTHIFDADANEGWLTIESAYTSANKLDFTNTVFDAGQPYYGLNSDYDQAGTQNWTKIDTYLSTASLTDSYFLLFDAGQGFYGYNSDNDQAGNQTWTQVNSYFATASLLDTYFVLFDAGQGYYGYNSDYDQAGNQTWSVVNTYMATASVIDTYYVAFDAGQPYFAINSDYDQAGSQTWSTVDTYYSAASVIDYYRVTFDAGQAYYSFDINYDQAANQTWSSIATYYSAPGIIDSETTYYDAGQPLHSRFVDYDQANAYAWNQHIVEYDTASHILNNYFI